MLASEHVPILFEMLRKRTLFAKIKMFGANKIKWTYSKMIKMNNFSNWSFSKMSKLIISKWFSPTCELSWIFPTASHRHLNSKAPSKHIRTISEWFRVLVLSFSLINWAFQSLGRTYIVRKINGKSPALNPAAWPAAWPAAVH